MKIECWLLYDIAKGADSFIWNGHSTINSQSQFLCLDTNALQGTSDSMKRTQYFNLLTYCWEQMSHDRSEKVMLICDEAYLMIDHEVPQSLIYLRNVMKRGRTCFIWNCSCKWENTVSIILRCLTTSLRVERGNGYLLFERGSERSVIPFLRLSLSKIY